MGKTDLKFSTVCEKMSENRRSQGGELFFDSHCIDLGSSRDMKESRTPPIFKTWLRQWGWVTLGSNLGVFPLEQTRHVGVAKSEHPKLTNGEIIFEEFQPM